MRVCAVWTEEMCAKLRERYPTENTKVLAEELGVTPKALVVKAGSMNVNKAAMSGMPRVNRIALGSSKRSKESATYSPAPGVTVHRLLG